MSRLRHFCPLLCAVLLIPCTCWTDPLPTVTATSASTLIDYQDGGSVFAVASGPDVGLGLSFGGNLFPPIPVFPGLSFAPGEVDGQGQGRGAFTGFPAGAATVKGTTYNVYLFGDLVHADTSASVIVPFTPNPVLTFPATIGGNGLLCIATGPNGPLGYGMSPDFIANYSINLPGLVTYTFRGPFMLGGVPTDLVSSIQFTSIPEPSSLALALLTVVGLSSIAKLLFGRRSRLLQ